MKYQRFASKDCKDVGIRRFKFVAKTQFQFMQRDVNARFTMVPLQGLSIKYELVFTVFVSLNGNGKVFRIKNFSSPKKSFKFLIT